MTRRERDKAFSLVEILVVIIVLLLLLALLLPVYFRSKGKAYETVCTENLRQYYAALQMYRDNYGDYPPNDLQLIGWDPKKPDVLTCPTWRTFGITDPPYELWAGMAYVPAGSSTIIQHDKDLGVCRDNRGSSLPLIIDWNHTRNPQKLADILPGAPMLILREGGQVTIRIIPTLATPPTQLQLSVCPLGEPLTY